MAEEYPNRVDQGESGTDPADAVWADVWNPHSNAWHPSDTPLETWALAEPPHGDVLTADPMSEAYGHPTPAGSGSTQDPRMNLLTDVRDVGTTPAPTQVIRHEVTTSEAGSEVIRARTVPVVGNVIPTRLLEENPHRKRALIKVVTSNQIILVGPAFGGMGSPQLTATPTQAVGSWLQATGDPVLEIKSQAAVDAIGVNASATGVIMVTIWEEINVDGNAPGLTGA